MEFPVLTTIDLTAQSSSRIFESLLQKNMPESIIFKIINEYLDWPLEVSVNGWGHRVPVRYRDNVTGMVNVLWVSQRWRRDAVHIDRVRYGNAFVPMLLRRKGRRWWVCMGKDKYSTIKYSDSSSSTWFPTIKTLKNLRKRGGHEW